jgi:serine/threonine protein kinase
MSSRKANYYKPAKTAKVKSNVADGGEFIGEGTYGCTFYPHLPCTDKSTYPDSIGKIFSRKSSLQDEQRLNDKILKIDPEGRFTLPFNGVCTVDAKRISVQDKMSPCEKFTPRQKQLIYKYGGIDLKKFYKTYAIAHPDVFIDDIIPLLLPLLDGITTLVQSGLVHTDIKPDNMVYDPKKKQLFLIDFGLLTKMQDIQYHSNLLTHPYLYYPLEFLIMDAVKRRGNVSTALGEFASRMTRYSDFVKFINQVRGISIAEQIRTFTISVSKVSRYDFDNMFNSTYVRKIDIYSIGISFLEIIYKLHKNNALRVRDEQLLMKFMLLLSDMSHMDPNKRLFPEEAAIRLRDILQLQQATPSAPPSSVAPNDKKDKKCTDMLAREIKAQLEKLGLPKYGTKDVMCKRLENAHVKAANTSPSVGKKKCTDMLAREIKVELEKYGLPKYGTKAQMCERLANASPKYAI